MNQPFTKSIIAKKIAPILVAMLLLASASGHLMAQVTITGKVLDASNKKEPLIGASVLIKNTSTGATTDFEGNFELSTSQALPITLVVGYIGYTEKEVIVENLNEPLEILLAESGVVIEKDLVIEGQRVSDEQKKAPLTIESFDLLAIKETPSDNFYDGLGSLKGVDLTAASLGFKVINTRGFNSTSPVRSLQLIDGVDNQAPGLNFSLGNFLGTSELDVLKVDLVVGASSAFYGPGAFNGVISMETKNPFYQKGLSASVKAGERNLLETAVRWADAFNDSEGNPLWGYKFNFSYLRADDWQADNYDPVFETLSGVDNPGRFDAVNTYGDEYRSNMDYSSAAPWNFIGLGRFHRTGYNEVDLVNYDTRNTKANAAFHLRTNPSQKEESPELIFSANFGSGTTVYQGDNRFSLKDILFYQGRLEYRKKGKFFIRAYSTQTDAGNSYDPYFTASRLQEAAKSDADWGVDYINWWRNNIEPKMRAAGYPELEIQFDPATGTVVTTFDTIAADAWLAQNYDSLVLWHSQTADIANLGGQGINLDFYQPGTQRFDSAFASITSRLSNDEDGGTRFYDRSSLYHVQGEYSFEPSWANYLRVGGNMRYYTPVTRGTIFGDSADVVITNFEVGMYVGFEKSFMEEKVTLNATLRTDKNQNFDWLFSPAASLVWQPSEGNFLRVSFSSAIRNPTLSDQYLSLNVGPAILSGNLNGVDSLITLESFDDYRDAFTVDTLRYFNIDPVRPEQVRTFEIGYRTTLFDALFVDASYYFNFYNNFLGFNVGVDAEFDDNTGLIENLQVYRYSANSNNLVTTQGFAIGLNYYFADYFMLGGNYSWNRLNRDIEDDPIIPAFNTPEHKFNISFSGRDVKFNIGNIRIENLGFNINYKWIEGFLFEGSPQFTGFIPTYDLLDAQINYKAKSINTTFKIGASNLLNNMQFQTYGGPRIGRLAYISAVYEFKKD